MAASLGTRCLRRRPSPYRPPLMSSPSSSWPSSSRHFGRRPAPPLRCSSPPVDAGKGAEDRPSVADGLLLAFFRSKMVEEVGWDSGKPGYAGLMEVANRLMVKGKSASETEESAVRVLRSLFPPLLLVLFKALLAPIANGQLASAMVARATALSCQWLMGPCSVNSVTLPDGKSWSSGVFVEKCKCIWKKANALAFASTRANCQPSNSVLAKSGLVRIYICALQRTFFKDHMGVDLYMEPNFEDYSCQFNFGVQPPPFDTDKALKEPCLDICTNARRRKELGSNSSSDEELSCPQV